MPYTYFADNLVRQGNLKQKYSVIIFPHAGGAGTGLVYGGVQGNEPRPYQKTAETPHLGIQDSTDDMRGGLGYDGLQELIEVRAGRRRPDYRRRDIHNLPRIQPDARHQHRNRARVSTRAAR